LQHRKARSEPNRNVAGWSPSMDQNSDVPTLCEALVHRGVREAFDPRQLVGIRQAISKARRRCGRF
jgi:hypothetical protein